MTNLICIFIESTTKIKPNHASVISEQKTSSLTTIPQALTPKFLDNRKILELDPPTSIKLKLISSRFFAKIITVL